MKWKNIIKFLATVTIITFIPIASIAMETIKGKIVGFNSIIHGKESPTDVNDPHIDLEPDFVILMSNGDHYLIPNVPLRVKKKYIYQSVKITGNINFKHRSIEADEFKVRGKRKFKVVWTNAEQKRRQEQKNSGWTIDAH